MEDKLCQPSQTPLLRIEHLSVSFRRYDDSATSFFRAQRCENSVVHDLSLSVYQGEMVAVIGESGSGKSVLADAIMGMYEPNADVTGIISFEGRMLSAPDIASLCGHGISYVPQHLTSLDPLMKVGKFVREGTPPKQRGRRERTQWKRERVRRQKELFERFGLPEEAAAMYPHELSGGMARRVLVCSALIDNPKLIIADEPTSGLDRNLALSALGDFRDFANSGGGVLLITHDIELALQTADRIAVFKDGMIVEETAAANFASPELLQSEYARMLWHALPEHDFAYDPDKTGGVEKSHTHAAHEEDDAPC